MRVLIACEYSGTMRDAFASLGHEAWSCDLFPSDIPGPHLIGDARKFLGPCQANNYKSWDLLIAHPPCTYLSYAAKAYWKRPGRAEKRIEAAKLFIDFWNAPVDHICIENPLGIMDAILEKHHQIINPYYFGDCEMKRTCLWLKNLPKLIHVKQKDLFTDKTHSVNPEPIYVDKSGTKRYFTDAISGINRGGHKRSKSFQGIANAMAEQWTKHIENRIQ